MPRKFNAYEPDAIDCNTMWSAICHDFGVIPSLSVAYERDRVVIICKCYKVAGEEPNVVQVQAMATKAQKGAGSQYAMQYSVLLDCWHQLDRGVLGAKTRPIDYSWNGRPQVPAKTGK